MATDTIVVLVIMAVIVGWVLWLRREPGKHSQLGQEEPRSPEAPVSPPSDRKASAGKLDMARTVNRARKPGVDVER